MHHSSKAKTFGPDGILGTDSLALQRVEFDFEAQTMAVVPANTPDFREEPGTIVVEARRKNGHLIVTEATANGRNIVVIVDTGSQVTIGNEALRKALKRSDLLPQTYPVDLISVHRIGLRRRISLRLRAFGSRLVADRHLRCRR